VSRLEICNSARPWHLFQPGLCCCSVLWIGTGLEVLSGSASICLQDTVSGSQWNQGPCCSAPTASRNRAQRICWGQTFLFLFAMPPFSETALCSLAWWSFALAKCCPARYLGLRLLRSAKWYRVCGCGILRWHLEVVSESKHNPRTGSTVFLSSFF